MTEPTIPDLIDSPLADPSEPTPGHPVDAPAPSRARSRRRGDIRLVLASSLLSAAIASAATATLVSRPAPAPAAAAAVTAPAGATTTTAISVTTPSATAAPLATTAASAAPAVVTINSTFTTQGGGQRAATGTGVGSGFIYASNGYILTASHVVEGSTQLTVTLADGRTFAGTVAASDPTLDLAVVKIDATGLPTILLGSSAALQIGQTAIAIGDPLGQYPGSVTVGIVSGLDRSVTVGDPITRQTRNLTGLIQTDAAINEGNSGGPVLNGLGQAIGIVSAGSTTAQGIGFAVPIDAAARVMAAATTA